MSMNSAPSAGSGSVELGVRCLRPITALPARVATAPSGICACSAPEPELVRLRMANPIKRIRAASWKGRTQREHAVRSGGTRRHKKDTKGSTHATVTRAHATALIHHRAATSCVPSPRSYLPRLRPPLMRRSSTEPHHSPSSHALGSRGSTRSTSTLRACTTPSTHSQAPRWHRHYGLNHRMRTRPGAHRAVIPAPFWLDDVDDALTHSLCAAVSRSKASSPEA